MRNQPARDVLYSTVSETVSGLASWLQVFSSSFRLAGDG